MLRRDPIRPFIGSVLLMLMFLAVLQPVPAQASALTGLQATADSSLDLLVGEPVAMDPGIDPDLFGMEEEVHEDYSEEAAVWGSLAAIPASDTAPTDCVTGQFGWPIGTDPCNGWLNTLTSDFGFRNPPQNKASTKPGTKYHFGLDFGAANGTPIYAVGDGIVDYINDCHCFTSYVAVYHPQWDLTTLYYHMEMMKWSQSEIELINANLVTEEVGKGELLAWVGTGHLDLRVVPGRLQRVKLRRPEGELGPTIYKTVIPFHANSYIHPAIYYPAQSTGQMTVSRSDFKVRLGSQSYQYADSLWGHNDGIYLDVSGEDEVWISALVRNENKDTADVKAYLRRDDGVEILLHHFNYAAGTSKVNETMELAIGAAVDTMGLQTDLSGYVSLDGNPNWGKPSLDRFHARLPVDWVPADGDTHEVVFVATDSAGKTVKATLPIRRKDKYKVVVEPLKEYYVEPLPFFSVQIFDAETELPAKIDQEGGEELVALFNGAPAFLEEEWDGSYSYLARPLYPVTDEGKYPLKVDVVNRKDGVVGSDTGVAVVYRPPQPPAVVDRCGNRTEAQWDGHTWEWRFPFGPPLPCHPDDNASSFSFDGPGLQPGTQDGAVAVLSSGFSQSMAEMLQKAGVAAEQVPLDFSPTMVDRFPVLFVPSGGLAGLSQSEQMKERFARYVDAGGTLIVFAQPRGADFGLLPGGQVTGYGYDEDIHCVYRSAGISSFGPQLMGQEEELVSFNLDGFFSQVPETATVLLRRTISGMPAMFVYAYGQGRVFASSSYADQARAMSQGTDAEEALVRDLAIWGLNPGREYPTTAPDTEFNVPALLLNSSDTDAASVEYELIGPEGAAFGRFSAPLSLPAGGTAEVTVPVTISLELDDAAALTSPGIWRLNATLVDAEGAELVTLTDAGLFGVTVFEETPGGFRYQGEPYAMVVTSESEQYLPGEKPLFTFHVYNYSETEETFQVTWAGGERSVTVPAGSESTFDWVWETGGDSWGRIRAALSLDGRVVANAERHFWRIAPSADLQVVPEKENYRPDEVPAFDLTLENRIGRPYDVTGLLTVTRPGGNEVVRLPLNAQLSARGQFSLHQELPEPLEYGDYEATVQFFWNGWLVAQQKALFAVPKPIMDSWVTWPPAFEQSTPITLNIHNGSGRFKNEVSVRDVEWKIDLTDPNGEVVWQSAGTIESIDPGQVAKIPLTMERPPLIFGAYWLNWEFTVDGAVGNYHDRWIGREHLLANFGGEMIAGYDKLTYKAGETARLKAGIYNLGIWQLEPSIQVSFPAANFTWQGKPEVGLGRDHTWGQFFEVVLPADLPAGTYWPTMTVSPSSEWSREISSWPLIIEPSRLSAAVDAEVVEAGQPLPIYISNSGGARTTASVTARIVDDRDQTLAESTAELALGVGAQGTVALTVPPDLASGSYRVMVNGTDQVSAEPFSLIDSVFVRGVQAAVTVRSDRELYPPGIPVFLQGEVQSQRGRIESGTLDLAVYATDPALQGCPPGFEAPIGPNAHWVGACSPVWNKWAWDSSPQIYDKYLSAIMTGPGMFSLGTITGDPLSTDDDAQALLAEHTWRPLSYATIRVDGEDFMFGRGGEWIEAPRYDPDQKALTAVWSNGRVNVRQTITLEADNPGLARIRYQVENGSAEAHEVGIRMLLNMQMGSATGAPVWTDGQNPITHEIELAGEAVPDSLLSMRLNFPFVVAKSVIRTEGERAPDRMILGYYWSIQRSDWDYQPDPWWGLGDDSAVAYYWSPVALAPGETMDVGTRYGAGNITRATGEISTLVSLPAEISDETQDPFPVRGFVRNNSTSTAAENVSVTVSLPEGLALEPGQSLTQQINSLPPESEAQVIWWVRPSPEASGTLQVQVSSTAANLSGSTVKRPVTVMTRPDSPNAPAPVWSLTRPITTETTLTYDQMVRPFSPGKYYAIATLKGAGGQVLATDRYPFLVSQDQTLLTLQTDKAVYRPGETITLTGLVTNLGDAEASYHLNLSSAMETLLNEAFVLAPGESRPYVASLTANAAGTITLEATAGQARIAEAVTVAAPVIESSVEAPPVVGREPFDLRVNLANTGLVPASVQVDLGGDVRTFELSPGERLTDTRSLQIADDAEINVILSGDLTRNETMLIRQGERVQFTLNPAEQYLEGRVSIGYTLINAGELAAAFPLKLTLGDQQVERYHTLLPGESMTGSVAFTAPAGTQVLSWQTPYEAGKTDLYVHRPVLDQLSMTAAFPTDLTTDRQVALQLQNEGDNRLHGQVLVTTPWSTQLLPFDLEPGQGASLQGQITAAGSAGAGEYPVTAEAIVHGVTLAESGGTLSVVGPRLSVTPSLPVETAAGAEATFRAQVTNTGDMDAATTVVLDLPGVEQQEMPIFLAPGESMPVSFTVPVSPDLPTGENHGSFRVGMESTPFIYSVRGYEGSAVARLDQPFYAPGEVPVLHVQTLTQVPAASAGEVLLRISGEDLDLTFPVPAGAASFDLPLLQADGDRLISYGLYIESGRSLYLSTVQVRMATGSVTLYTDQPIYRPGETVTATVHAEGAGQLAISAPGYDREQTIAVGETRVTFTLPAVMPRGVHEIRYALNGEEHVQTIQIESPGVTVSEAILSKATEAGRVAVNAILTADASAPMPGAVVEWWAVDPAGNKSLSLTRTLDLPAGRSSIAVEGLSFWPVNTGLHLFTYTIHWNGIAVNQGGELFDVDGPSLLGLTSLQGSYRLGQAALFSVAAMGEGEAELTLLVDGLEHSRRVVTLGGYQTLTLPVAGLPEGPHRVTAVLRSEGFQSRASTWVRVLPLPAVSIHVRGAGTPVIELTATEPLARIYYHWNDGPDQIYSGSAAPPAPGPTSLLHAYAVINGISGPVTSREVEWDTVPPTIRIDQPLPGDYLHSDTVIPAIRVTDDGSGVVETATQVTLDGVAMDAGQPLDLYFLPLGDHVLVVEAEDQAGNRSEATVPFRVIATVASTISDLHRAAALGWIEPDGLVRSLEAKLEAAQKALDRDMPGEAVNLLLAFTREVEAQRGKQLTEQAADHLLADVEWVIQALRQNP